MLAAGIDLATGLVEEFIVGWTDQSDGSRRALVEMESELFQMFKDDALKALKKNIQADCALFPSSFGSTACADKIANKLKKLHKSGNFACRDVYFWTYISLTMNGEQPPLVTGFKPPKI